MKVELVILEGPHAGRRIPLGTEPVTFGRAAGATVSFPEDNFLSGLHLAAQLTAEGVLLLDRGSTNGSFLNGERFTRAVAQAGDELRVGSLRMRIEDAAPEAAATLTKADAIVRALAAAPLFCLVDAAADEMIPALLAVAQPQVPMQCLYDGESAVSLARWAPYLLQMPADFPLLRVLVERGWGKGWVSYFRAGATLEELRKHFRRFLVAQIENGNEVYFRFYDPRVLRDFLPTSSRSELTTFFGPVSEWIVEGPDGKDALRLRNGPEGLAVSVFRLPQE